MNRWLLSLGLFVASRMVKRAANEQDAREKVQRHVREFEQAAVAERNAFIEKHWPAIQAITPDARSELMAAMAESAGKIAIVIPSDPGDIEAYDRSMRDYHRATMTALRTELKTLYQKHWLAIQAALTNAPNEEARKELEDIVQSVGIIIPVSYAPEMETPDDDPSMEAILAEIERILRPDSTTGDGDLDTMLAAPKKPHDPVITESPLDVETTLEALGRVLSEPEPDDKTSVEKAILAEIRRRSAQAPDTKH